MALFCFFFAYNVKINLVVYTTFFICYYVNLTKKTLFGQILGHFLLRVFAVAKQQCLLLQTKLVQKAARATTKENSRHHGVYKYFIFSEDEKVQNPVPDCSSCIFTRDSDPPEVEFMNVQNH